MDRSFRSRRCGITLVMGGATAFVGVCGLAPVASIPVTVTVVALYTFRAFIILDRRGIAPALAACLR